ncbi:MAG: UDP-N-acetylmuramate:L-alanyl-gamma-D-glutamyl-meso-diaminopimelate ligase [Bacteriovoracaceae bacterium]|nr:UDP-N-acetylmuramate:L-alanyl-gamma-D-glutamyl-meso-diaminopimelate ligase [Bacteriovoracaceae bacterium]
MDAPKPGSRIYFLAICGTGMSALAVLLKSRGYQIAGSDIAAYPPVGDLLKRENIPVHLAYDVEDLKKFAPDYVVIGNFVRRDNPQAQYVLESKIPYGSFPSTLEDFFLKKTKNLVVVGTHGKTTTTTCLSHLLNFAGLDPSYLIGGIPVNLPSSSHFGEGSHFVIEGDEYDTAFFDKESKFLHYRPLYAIMMSLEYDHADIFPTNEAMEKMFRKFIHLVPGDDGIIFYCADWKRIGELLKEEKPKAKQISFGFSDEAGHTIEDFLENEKGMSFIMDGTRYQSSLTGKFNAQNLAAAILAARAAGVKEDVLVKAIAEFRGVKRRQEVRGEVGGHLVIDDFAHHPTAVREVIRGMRAKYPKHKIVVFFEPRSNTSRRAILQKEFESAFLDADAGFIAPVFKIEALPPDDRLDIPKIVKSHAAHGKKIFGPIMQEDMLNEAAALSKTDSCVFLVLSNGNFDSLHEKLLSRLNVK